MSTYPGVALLARHFPAKQAVALHKLMSGVTDPLSYSSVEKWVLQCYNMPRRNELIMEAIREELSGFGVEPIYGRLVDRYCQDIQATYVNMSDICDTTILFDNENDCFIVTPFVDWFKKHEQIRELR